MTKLYSFLKSCTSNNLFCSVSFNIYSLPGIPSNSNFKKCDIFYSESSFIDWISDKYADVLYHTDNILFDFNDYSRRMRSEKGMLLTDYLSCNWMPHYLREVTLREIGLESFAIRYDKEIIFAAGLLAECQDGYDDRNTINLFERMLFSICLDKISYHLKCKTAFDINIRTFPDNMGTYLYTNYCITQINSEIQLKMYVNRHFEPYMDFWGNYKLNFSIPKDVIKIPLNKFPGFIELDVIMEICDHTLVCTELDFDDLYDVISMRFLTTPDTEGNIKLSPFPIDLEKTVTIHKRIIANYCNNY